MQVNNGNWYNNIVSELVFLRVQTLLLRMHLLIGLQSNLYFETDANLCERFCHLVDLQNQSCKDIEELEQELLFLLLTGVSFSVTDLEDELDFIKENIDLEVSYFRYMYEYLHLVFDSTIQGEFITLYLEHNEDMSSSCYYMMEINNSNLKQLKKERRNDDYE